MGLPWVFNGTSMGLPSCFSHGFVMLPWVYRRPTIGLGWNRDAPMSNTWDSDRFVALVHGSPMGLLWALCGFIVLPWVSYGTLIGLSWIASAGPPNSHVSHGNPVGLLMGL